MTVSAPRWDLTNVYPALESKEFQNGIKKYKKMLNELEAFLIKTVGKADKKTDAKKLGKLLGEAVDRFNALIEHAQTLEAYIYSFITTDSRNKTAARLLSEFEQIDLRQRKLGTQFRAWVAETAR